VRSGIIFHSSKLPLTKKLRRQLGISYAAAWRVKHKLMQVIKEQEDGRKLHGNVVIDDAYLGGEHQGKRGRGSENKIPFVAAVQLNEEDHLHFVCFDLVTGFTKDAIGYWAKRFLSTSSKVVSDGLQCFSGVSQAGASHYP